MAQRTRRTIRGGDGERKMEIKKCPFCGVGKTEVFKDRTLLNGHYYYYVKHVSETNVCGLVDAFGAYRSRLFSTPEKAVAAWNGRVDE